MKKKLFIFTVICLGVCGVVWANSGTRVGAANIQSELPASADRHQELSALISTMLRVYQNGGPGALERFFPLSPEERKTLQNALRILSDVDRQIVMLHAVSDLRHREIADLLSLPLSTVLSKYHRALLRLRNALKED